MRRLSLGHLTPARYDKDGNDVDVDPPWRLVALTSSKMCDPFSQTEEPK